MQVQFYKFCNLGYYIMCMRNIDFEMITNVFLVRARGLLMNLKYNEKTSTLLNWYALNNKVYGGFFFTKIKGSTDYWDSSCKIDGIKWYFKKTNEKNDLVDSWISSGKQIHKSWQEAM